MRLLINVFVATLMLLGSLAAPCIAAPVDHDHAGRVSISATSTSGGHLRGDGRCIAGSECWQYGIVAQVTEAPYTEPDFKLFGATASVEITGIPTPVEQRPPIASV